MENEVLYLGAVVIVVFISAVVTVLQTRSLMAGYSKLVEFVTTHQPLNDELRRRYAGLSESERKVIDSLLDGLGLLSRLTPTPVDDALDDWQKAIKDAKNKAGQ